MGLTVSACRTETDFKCANNLCLPNSVKCDGVAQCDDASDEAEQVCGAFVLYSTYSPLSGLLASSVGPFSLALNIPITHICLLLARYVPNVAKRSI